MEGIRKVRKLFAKQSGRNVLWVRPPHPPQYLKEKGMKKVILVLALAFVVVGCSKPADVISTNISTEADYFKILRRVIFYNGITGDYMLSIEGYCSLGNNDAAGTLSVTCKVGEDKYKKHFLGLSDNVTYFVEQIDGANVSADHYKVVFKPSVIVPDIEVR